MCKHSVIQKKASVVFFVCVFYRYNKSLLLKTQSQQRSKVYGNLTLYNTLITGQLVSSSIIKNPVITAQIRSFKNQNITVAKKCS